MKKRYIRIGPAVLLSACLLLIAAGPVLAGGGQERKDRAEKGKIEQEEERTVRLYLVTDEGRGVAATKSLPGSEAAFFLFQSFKNKGGAVRITSQRSFSMPIQDRGYLEIEQGLGAVWYEVELTPETSVAYTTRKRTSLTFEAGELVSGSGRRTQPASYAAMQALQNSDVEEGLVRVAELDLSEGGEFSAEVEIAESAPQKKQ